LYAYKKISVTNLFELSSEGRLRKQRGRPCEFVKLRLRNDWPG